ncbi:MAG TPA: fused MFS/spermidine synthase [Candidatus Eisenbacteria bacterium]|nr:fused MFS/spermidine synthase [Candidatus Eisenbacteria bacterium]
MKTARRMAESRPGAGTTASARASARGSAHRRALLYGCFFASGAAGLLLEVVWSKYLSLLLGNSIHGVATVVAAFLGGLGLGAAIGGRWASRVRDPLLAYGVLEGVVAVLGLASPLAYAAARPVFAELNALLMGQGEAFLLVRFFVLFAALLVPTCAMGATLPLVVTHFARRDPDGAGPQVARLYAINTAGAVIGVAAAGFLAIPALGLWKTAALAAAIDLAVAAAMVFHRPPTPAAERPSAAPEATRGDVRAAAAAEPASVRGARYPASAFASWILPAFAVSGFTAILYEIAWTRILTVPFGGMVYAFSAILAIYLAGIALGAAAASRLLQRVRASVALFGMLQVALAACAALGAHLYERLPHWQAEVLARAGESTERLLWGEAWITVRLIFPACLVLGALFPTAVAIRRRQLGGAGASVGSVYAANTLGSIVGSIATAFFLIPWIGTLQAVLAAAVINAALGILAILFSEARPAVRAGGALAAAAGIAGFAMFATPSWNPERMSLGLVRLLRAHWFGGESIAHQMIDRTGKDESLEKLLFYKEGRVAAVTVVDMGERRALIINGKTDATTGVGEDMAQQVLVGQLPLLLRPEAASVCVVGYGSGVTTHAVLTHPVRNVLTIELEGAVVEAAPLFEADAGRPADDPRSRILIEDAGTYLRSTRDRYDAIISEPSNLWIAGMADLFTRDFYRTAGSKLRPGGIFCQWVQTYQTSPATLRTVFRTLATRFPHGQLFFIDHSGDLVILASDEPMRLDLDRLAAAMARPDVAGDLARVGVTSLPDLLRYYRGTLERVARESGSGPVNTDDNGWLEHRAPYDLLAGSGSEEELAWSPDVASDLAASIASDRTRALQALEEGAARAKAAGNEGGFLGLTMAREILSAR